MARPIPRLRVPLTLIAILAITACGRTGTYDFAPFSEVDAGTGESSPPDLLMPAPDAPRPRPRILSIACGALHTCAGLSDGSARCWGSNDHGQLGGASGSPSASPIPVGGIDGVVALAAGLAHTCAISAAGQIHCWGADYDGELGYAAMEDNGIPVLLNGTGVATAVFTGADDTFILRADGTALALGENDTGELGSGDVGAPHAIPVHVNGGTVFLQLSASDGFTCGALMGGSARCWGKNHDGQLGRGTLEDSPLPIPVVGLTGATQVATGDQHACALRQDGTVACWGQNESGAIGDGTSFSRRFVTNVVGLTGATQIAAGGEHTCALLHDGTVRCWGANIFGQLGDGSQVDRHTPATVLGLTGVIAISAGQLHTCALRGGADPELRCWGGNGSGQIGDHTSATRLSPTKVNVVPNN